MKKFSARLVSLVVAFYLGSCATDLAPKEDASTHTPSSTTAPYVAQHGPKATTPAKPATPGGTLNPVPAEAAAKCSLRYDQVSMGSVRDGMGRTHDISVAQTMIPTSPVFVGTGYVESITGSIDADRELLAAHFGSSLEIGGEIYQAAEGTPLFPAIQYLNGTLYQRGSSLTWAEYYVAARAARTLAMVVALKSDPNCVADVLAFAQRSFGVNAKDLLKLPFVDAAVRLKDGTLPTHYAELDEKRAKIKSDIEDLKNDLVSKGYEHDEKIAEAKEDVITQFEELRDLLADIGPCAKDVKRNDKLISADSSESAQESRVHELVMSCRKKVTEALAKEKLKQDKILADTKRINHAKEKIEELAEKKGGISDAKMKERIALDVRETKINVDLGVVQEAMEKLADNKKALFESDNAISKSMLALQKSIRARKLLESQKGDVAVTKAIKAKESEYKLISPNWITYGLVGDAL